MKLTVPRRVRRNSRGGSNSSTDMYCQDTLDMPALTHGAQQVTPLKTPQSSCFSLLWHFSRRRRRLCWGCAGTVTLARRECESWRYDLVVTLYLYLTVLTPSSVVGGMDIGHTQAHTQSKTKDKTQTATRNPPRYPTSYKFFKLREA